MMGSRGRHGRLAFFLVAWVVTRAAMLSQLPVAADGGLHYEDVNLFVAWAQGVAASHRLPEGTDWQYPPGAIYVFLLPQALPGHERQAFIALFLLADLAIMLALACLSSRTRATAGVWTWILAVPFLGKLPLLRFDLIPTALAVAALTLPSGRRSGYVAGLLVGLGAVVKVWPVLALLAAPSRREGWRTAIAAGAAVLLVVLGTALWAEGALGFLARQGGRGLEIEAVAATPWYFGQALTGRRVRVTDRNGTQEIADARADALAALLRAAMVLLGAACAAWWLARTRRGAWPNPEVPAAVGRDAAFAATLLYLVVSPVLSPQYLIWALGLGAVAACYPGSRVRRPIALMVASALLTHVLLGTWGELISGGATGPRLLVARNAVLLVAALDAARAILRVPGEPGAPETRVPKPTVER